MKQVMNYNKDNGLSEYDQKNRPHDQNSGFFRFFGMFSILFLA